MNHIVGDWGTEGCYRQARGRRLSSVEVTLFEPGQPVVWTYQSQVPPRQIYLVEAEVMHVGPFRARIRLRDSEGHILLRWVKPERLRPKQETFA